MKYPKLLFLPFLFWATFSVAQSKPNIVVFMVDDMGWQDCSVPFFEKKTAFNKIYETPNMERLAAGGMKFTNAYSTPVCTPTRVSLMTGMNAARHKVTMWTNVLRDQPTDAPDSMMIPPNWNYNGFDPTGKTNNTFTAVALPQILKENGYYTIHVGKAHFGSTGTPGADPKNVGFMVNVAGTAAGHPASYLGMKNFGNPADGIKTTHGVQDLSAYHQKDIFLTEALTQEAIKEIDKRTDKQQPFFLYLAHYAIHVPLDADKRYLDKYLAKGLDSTEAKYASLIEGMDKSLGDLMDYLEKKGLDKNTAILFMSDNGGLSLSPPRSGKAHTQNLPLRAGKGSVYEGGIRVPMIAKWPGKINAGAVNKEAIIIEDFFPTILQIAGISPEKYVSQIDGESFHPRFSGKSANNANRLFVWHVPNKWVPKDGPGINFYGAARLGKWKYVYSMRTGKKELYNLADDIGELQDLSGRYPEKTMQIAQLLEKRLTELGAQFPQKR
jgi:arylsulfatase A-like enzyme